MKIIALAKRKVNIEQYPKQFKWNIGREIYTSNHDFIRLWFYCESKIIQRVRVNQRKGITYPINASFDVHQIWGSFARLIGSVCFCNVRGEDPKGSWSWTPCCDLVHQRFMLLLLGRKPLWVLVNFAQVVHVMPYMTLRLGRKWIKLLGSLVHVWR